MNAYAVACRLTLQRNDSGSGRQRYRERRSNRHGITQQPRPINFADYLDDACQFHRRALVRQLGLGLERVWPQGLVLPWARLNLIEGILQSVALEIGLRERFVGRHRYRVDKINRFPTFNLTWNGRRFCAPVLSRGSRDA